MRDRWGASGGRPAGSKALLKSCTGCIRGVTATLPSSPLHSCAAALSTLSSPPPSVSGVRSVAPLGGLPLHGCGDQPAGGTTLQMPYGTTCSAYAVFMQCIYIVHAVYLQCRRSAYAHAHAHAHALAHAVHVQCGAPAA